jgi:Secretion system C-terminal sorting domain
MKKIILSLSFMAIISVATWAQSWNYVGSQGFSGGLAEYVSIAVDSSGTPYVTYSSHVNGFAATVRKFTGTTWKTVGVPGISGPDQATYTRIAIAPDGTTPYLVYSDAEHGYKATVRKFTTQWDTVGNALLSAGYAYSTSIAFAPDSTPYLSYEDGGNGYKLTVMKLSGNQWVTVGTAGFTPNSIGTTSLAIAPDGTPYVAYMNSDPNWGGQTNLVVQKFNGTTWEVLASTSVHDAVQNPSIAIAADGTVYVGFRNDDNSSKATVMKYSGSAWSLVGGTTASTNDAYWPKMALSNDGTPYIAYLDGVTWTATVMKYNGSAWTAVSSNKAVPANYLDFAIAKDGTLYVGFQDYIRNSYASLIKYAGTGTDIKMVQSSKLALSAYPNPSRGEIAVDYQLDKASDVNLKLYNALGELQTTVVSKNEGVGSHTLHCNVSQLPQGVYVLDLQTTTGSQQQKITIIK